MMNSIKKNFFYNVFYQLLTFITPLITTPYISRVIGAEGLGIFSYYYSIASYFVLCTLLGLNNYGNREIAIVNDDKKKISKVFWEIYIFQMIVGVLVSILYLMYIYFFSENKVVSALMIPYVISAILDINWFFFGMELFQFTVLRNIIIKICTVISIIIFVHTKEDILNYCAIITLSAFLSQVLLWPRVMREVEYIRPSKEAVIKHIRPNMILFLTVIAVSIYKIMDKIMLGIMSSKIEVGFYEASEKMVSLPIALIESLGIVMLPHMSNLISRNDSNTNSIIEKSMSLAMFLSTSMSFGLMAISKLFVPLYYGDGFDKCKTLYLILLPSCVFLAFANVIRTQYLIPHKEDKVYVKSAFIGAGVNLCINTLLIKKYGSIGAAYGTLFAEISVCLYQAIFSKKGICMQRIIKNSIPFVFSGLGMFLFVYYLPIHYISWTALVKKILLGIITYLILLTILCRTFNKEAFMNIKGSLLKRKG